MFEHGGRSYWLAGSQDYSEGTNQQMIVERDVRTTEGNVAQRSENKGLTQVVEMAPVSVPEPVAPAPNPSGSTGDGAQGGGTPPVDFDG